MSSTFENATVKRGPWFVQNVPGRGLEVAWRADGPICHMRWTDGLRADVEKCVADDARLIAAAPDLLSALEELVEVDDDHYLQCREGGSLVSALTSARNAIAKAKEPA